MNTAILLLLKINMCSFPLQCSCITKAQREQTGYPFWGQKELGTKNPTILCGRQVSLLQSFLSIPALLFCALWFSSLWRFILRSELGSADVSDCNRSNKLQFCLFAETKFTAVPATMILQSYFLTWSRVCRNKLRDMKAINRAEGLVDWATMTSIIWQNHLRQNWDLCK